MTGQQAAKPPVLGEGKKTLTKHLKRLWTLLTTEEVLHEDGTSTRQTTVRRAIRS
jgi:hypothetical protein